MKTTAKKQIAFAIGAGALLVAVMSGYSLHSYGYAVNDNWCDRDELRLNVNAQSFTDHYYDSSDMDIAIRTAATWWSDAQAGLRWKYNVGNSTSTSAGDPGVVYMKCQSEDSYFSANPFAVGYTFKDFSWHPTCDTFGLNIDAWKVAIRSDLDDRPCCHPGDPSPCPSSSWGLDIAGVRSGLPPLFMTLSHEFGHAWGLDHDCTADGHSTMCNQSSSSALLTYDDGNGAILGLGEGKSSKVIQTVSATRSGGTLTFGTTQTTTLNAMWKPAIGSAPPGWFNDYAIAWIDPISHEIKMAPALDDGSDNLVLGPVEATGQHSRNAIGVAQSAQSRIGIGFTSSDDSTRTPKFMVTPNGGFSWTVMSFPNFPAQSGVSVSYDRWASRWVMSWVLQGPQSTTKYKIVTVVSSGSDGLSWNNPVISYTDTLTMPNLAPALTCERSDTNRCLMLYRTFAISSIRTIRQQAFQLNVGNTQLDTISTFAETGDYGYSDLSVARFDGGYIYTYVWPTIANDKLAYRIKTDTAGEGGAFNFALQTGPASMLSRSGFSVAFNYRTGRFRFLWKDN